MVAYPTNIKLPLINQFQNGNENVMNPNCSNGSGSIDSDQRPRPKKVGKGLDQN